MAPRCGEKHGPKTGPRCYADKGCGHEMVQPVVGGAWVCPTCDTGTRCGCSSCNPIA